MKYDELIERVTSNPTLAKVVQDVVENENVLNLVTPNWKDVLSNNIIYQDFSSGKVDFRKEVQKTYIRMQYIKDSVNKLSVLVLGTFYLTRDAIGVHLLSQDCPPLDSIYRAMMRRQPSHYDEAVLHKFSIKPCKVAFCPCCSSIRAECLKRNINMEKHWCVKRNRSFNGLKLKNLLEANLKDEFGGSIFFGLASMRVDGRYFYDEGKSKLFGEITNLVLFRQSSLELVEETLNIEYPESDEEELPPEEEASALEEVIEAIPKNAKRKVEEEESTSWDIKYKTAKFSP